MGGFTVVGPLLVDRSMFASCDLLTRMTDYSPSVQWRRVPPCGDRCTDVVYHGLCWIDG